MVIWVWGGVRLVTLAEEVEGVEWTMAAVVESAVSIAVPPPPPPVGSPMMAIMSSDNRCSPKGQDIEGIFLNTSLDQGRASKLRELEFFP